MNKIEKIKEKLRLLRVVRDNITLVPLHVASSPYDTAICRQIWNAHHASVEAINSNDFYKIREYLTNYISKVLGRHAYYHDWLSIKIGRYPSAKEAREGRIQWLDWMIASYEEKLKRLKK